MNTINRHAALALLASACMAAPVNVLTHAQPTDDPKDAILILDASGSMWGQIDGINKIVIAKDTVEELLLGLDPEQRLGFVAYGHRREGDCADIETLANVGASRDDIIDALRNVTPKGKTPLSKSVEHAAIALDYTRKAATVILISDGLENCEVDPCAMARTLEDNGLDFTVHVVGFDVTEQERKGLACVAKETGGTFVAADSADELAGALRQVADAGAPSDPGGDVATASVTMKATILSGGPYIRTDLAWTVREADGGRIVFEDDSAAFPRTGLSPGDYIVSAAWSGWQDGLDVKTGELAFSLRPSQPKVVTVPVDLGFTVTLDAPASSQEGVAFPVTWTGPDELGAYIHVASVEDGPRRPIYSLAAAKTRAKAGVAESNAPVTADIGAPSTDGQYEIRYVLDEPRIIVARRPITITDGHFSVSGPDQAPISSRIKVTWSGQATPGDIVTIIEADATAAFKRGFVKKLGDGDTVELTTPSEPGDYELRYVLANGYTLYPNTQHAVQASQPIKLLPVSAGISGPDEVIGGSTVEVTVALAPDLEDDFVSIVPEGAIKPNRDARIGLTKAQAGDGGFRMQAPNIEGNYEIVYFLHPGTEPLARHPLVIRRATASVDAPDTVKVGQPFDVTWQGPGYRGDRVVMSPADSDDRKAWGVGTRYGFAVPEGETQGVGQVRNDRYPEPGEYIVRYVTGLQHQVLARDTLSVVE
ncbi:MAG: VWA domain-containing protein [Pseudomonadota bacterium]